MKNLSLKAKFFGLNAMFVGVNATVLVALILGSFGRGCRNFSSYIKYSFLYTVFWDF